MKAWIFALSFLTLPIALEATPRHPLYLLVELIEWMQWQSQPPQPNPKSCSCTECHEYKAAKKMHRASKRAAKRCGAAPYAGKGEHPPTTYR
jgi:hypothetical protein